MSECTSGVARGGRHTSVSHGACGRSSAAEQVPLWGEVVEARGSLPQKSAAACDGVADTPFTSD